MGRGSPNTLRGPRTPAGMRSGLNIPTTTPRERPSTGNIIGTVAKEYTSATAPSRRLSRPKQRRPSTATENISSTKLGQSQELPLKSPAGSTRTRQRRPSTALEMHSSTSLGQQQDYPSTSRVPSRFTAEPGSILDRRASRTIRKGLGTGRRLMAAATANVTTLDIQRTQWVEKDGGEEVGRLDGGAGSEKMVKGPERNECGPETEDSRAGGPTVTRRETLVEPTERLLWGVAMKELTTTVSNVVSRLVYSEVGKRERKNISSFQNLHFHFSYIYLRYPDLCLACSWKRSIVIKRKTLFLFVVAASHGGLPDSLLYRGLAS